MREAVGTMGSHRVSSTRFARACVCAAAAIGLLLVLAASASAFSQRGHEFKASFPAPGEEGQLSGPAGVAVNEATGDIYVVDSGNNRLVRFSSAHKFLAAWGWGVTDGKKEFEVCTAKCLPGLRGHGAGEFANARSIAVDNSGLEPSAGDVYVETVTPFTEGEKSFELGIITKFSPTGEVAGHPAVIDEFKSAKGEKFEEPNGVAVDPKTGQLWIYDEEFFAGFSNAVENKVVSIVSSESEGEGTPGFAFDAKAGPLGGFLAAHALPSGGGTISVIAKDVLLEEENTAHELELIAVPTAEALDAVNSTGVASDSKTGDAYVDHGGSVAAFDGQGHPIQTFGAGHLSGASGLAADATHSQVLAADNGANLIEVFGLEEPAAPTVDELAAAGTTATETTLSALIDPHGAATTYAFRYSTGPVPKASEPCTSPCVQAPVTPAELPGEFGHKAVEAKLKELSPSTVYHYRVFAENHAGGGDNFAEAEAETEGGELTFKTQATLLGETLPDGRQWELVSPQKKNGAAVQVMPSEGGLSQASEDGAKMTYTFEGAFAGESEPEGNRAPEVTQALSSRSGTGWSTADIDTKHNEAEGVTPGNAQEYHAFSSDLSLGIVEPFGSTLLESPPLSSEASERTPYVRHNATCAASPATCYQPLVNPSNVQAGVVFGSQVAFQWSNPSMSNVVLRSTAHLTGEAATSGPSLYDASAGSLKMISTLPTGLPASGPSLGFANGNLSDLRHAVSDDGTRFVFTTYFGETNSGLYMRPIGQQNSIRLDVAEAGVTQAAGQCQTGLCLQPQFQDASADGSEIFFTDQERLTKASGANYLKPDLYVCEVQEAEVSGETKVTGCKLTDLSAGKPGESGNVQGNLIGASEDGSTVYFAADGALGGGESGTCRSGEIERNKEAHEGEEAQPIATACNLYVEHREGAGSWATPKLLQRLSGEDEYDWGTTPSDLSRMVARVSPNGQWLAFMSDRSLTPPYNTRDKTSDRPAEEVYLYNDATGKTVCASCDPSGARPEAILDRQASGEGIGLLVDRPLLWTSRRLASNIPSYVKISGNNADYQPRFLSDEGRLFFNSAESLVPQDKNGKEDVYQYEPAGITTGGCSEGSETFVTRALGCVSLISSGKAPKESAFLDAGTTGLDVFFATPEQLVTLDNDSSYDVYDATVCGTGGRPACLAPPTPAEKECESSGECRPGATGTTTFGGAASEGPSSGGNVSPQHEVLGTKESSEPAKKTTPLTRKQKLAKALKSCKKLKKKSKRKACEVQARKKYGTSAKKSAHRAAFHTAGHRS